MMRVYGRTYANDGTYTWGVVTTDSFGRNDQVYITQLIQVLLLERGESPFYANYGIPARRSVATQIPPDFYVLQTQTQFSPFFASLVISKQSDNPPTYKINLVTNQGVPIELTVPR